ncbi:zinc ribbon domain-containing protein [Acidithiobacillus ferrivorans]|nr:zinc ribbon domain-containing protein [Acidithiobacillus ferrivorans]
MFSSQSMTGSFTGRLFFVGKWFSIFFAFLALITVIVGAIYLLSLGSTFKVPAFDAQARQTMIGSMPSQQSSVAQQKEQVKLNAEYGAKIVSIISKYNITNIKTAQMITALMQMKARYRSAFISGWGEFLRHGVAYAKKNGVYQAAPQVVTNGYLGGTTPSTADILTNQYSNDFSTAIETSNEGKTKEHIERLTFFGLIISAMIIFILAMVVPVLVQIEKNTRGLGLIGESSASSAMPVRATAYAAPVSAQKSTPSVCFKCHAPVTANDVFCGNCGAGLRD